MENSKSFKIKSESIQNKIEIYNSENMNLKE
jgi:hypothetical protein